MIVPLPIFITDPGEAETMQLRLLGDLKAAAERASSVVFPAADAVEDAVHRTSDVGEMRELGDALVALMGPVLTNVSPAATSTFAAPAQTRSY